MHMVGATMQKGLKISKKLASTFDCLTFFALNKEGTIEEAAAFIGKDYTTALRIIRKLEDADSIKLERLERTNAKGKKKRVYRVMLHGLFTFMVLDQETATSKFEEITEAHSDKLLTFKKWGYFKSRKLDKVVRNSFFRSMGRWVTTRIAIFNFTSSIEGKPAFPKMYTDENTARAVDADVLGLALMADPPEHLRELLGEQKWDGLMKLLRAIEEDYELRMFKGEILFRFEKVHEERLKALKQWKVLCEKLGATDDASR